MTTSSLPATPGPREARPSAPVDLSDAWSDSNKGARGDAGASFSSRPSNVANEHTATIGHIGRYALKHQLGAGGLGTVYAAYDPLLSRLIAVKTLHLEVAEDQRAEFNALFLNEARAAAGLSHPQIVTVFDAGISDDRAYIAMELLKGRDLRQLRQEGWRASPSQAALIVRRVADALAYAHSKGVVHRDIKPANIFMVGRTQPRVLDFGIARVAHRRDASGSADTAAGSPYYMAPEQARQQPVDRRADVFSLGVVLYEMLTDTKPFRGTSLAEITDAVLHHEPPPADAVDPKVPGELATIAAKAMAKDPEGRYRSARAFARDLRQWSEAHPGPVDADVTPAASRRTPWLWLSGGAVLACALLGMFAWLVGAARDDAALARELPAAPGIDTAAAAPGAAPPVSATATAPTEATTPAVPTEPAASVPTPDTAAVATVAPPPPSADATSPPVPAAIAKEAARAAAPKETATDKRSRDARESREREARANAAAAPPAAVPTGIVRIAISPWGRVEVDGADAGIAPPLNELTLTEGKHQIVVRNEDFPPYNASVTVTAGQPVTLKYRFGS